MAGYRRFQISNELLLGMFAPGLHPAYEVVENGIPVDSQVTQVRDRSFEGMTEILISSDSLEMVVGVPFISPVLMRVGK
jgi:hypothetical protein